MNGISVASLKAVSSPDRPAVSLQLEGRAHRSNLRAPIKFFRAPKLTLQIHHTRGRGSDEQYTTMTKFIIAGPSTLQAATLFSQGERREWNFESDRLGSVPKGFAIKTGQWRVVTDNTALSGSNVLAQLAKSSRAKSNVCLVNDTVYRHMDLSVRLRAFAGKIDQGGGVVWRAKDGKNYLRSIYS